MAEDVRLHSRDAWTSSRRCYEHCNPTPTVLRVAHLAINHGVGIGGDVSSVEHTADLPIFTVSTFECRFQVTWRRSQQRESLGFIPGVCVQTRLPGNKWGSN
jgi:hypothetical protein